MKNKKRWLFFIVLLIFIGGCSYFVYKNLWEERMEVTIEKEKVTPTIDQLYQLKMKDFTIYPSPQTKSMQEGESLLKEFLEKNMLVNGHFLTNYKSNINESKSELAVGHDSLSESSGLWLRYLALKGSKDEYDQFYKKTKKIFFKNGQFSYRLNANGKLSPVNASIDDIRIMESLIEAANRFKKPQYLEELKQLLYTFEKQSLQGKVLVDFYDTKTGEAAHTVSLYYLSMKTLGYLYQIMDIPKKYLQYQYDILQNGYLSDTFPFYRAQYDYKKEKYVEKDKINVIESLLSILYLAEIGKAKPESIQYIKERVTTGTLYNAYTPEGEVVDKNQSAASYAIVAMIAKEIKDDFLYDQSMKILKNYQIMNPKSPIYGGIGNPTTLDVFSYNNLMALLAYCY